MRDVVILDKRTETWMQTLPELETSFILHKDMIPDSSLTVGNPPIVRPPFLTAEHLHGAITASSTLNTSQGKVCTYTSSSG